MYLQSHYDRANLLAHLDSINRINSHIKSLSNNTQNEIDYLYIYFIDNTTFTLNDKQKLISQIKALSSVPNRGIAVYAYGASTQCIIPPVIPTEELLDMLSTALIFNRDYVLNQQKNSVIHNVVNDLKKQFKFVVVID